MDSLNFIYWLQGFMEVADPKEITEEQVQVIKDHIGLVLDKKTPTRGLYIKHDPVGGEKYLQNMQGGTQALGDILNANGDCFMPETIPGNKEPVNPNIQDINTTLSKEELLDLGGKRNQYTSHGQVIFTHEASC